MLYKWLSSETHNVKTFNSVFNLSKLQGFNVEDEVSIGEMLVGGLREIKVNNTTLTIELKSANMKILLDKDFQGPTVSPSEYKIIKLIFEMGGKCLYKDIRDKLNLTTCAASKVIVSLRGKDIVKTTKLRDRMKNETIELIDNDISSLTVASK
jgi:hypothetical protein